MYIAKTYSLYQHIICTDYEDVHMLSMLQRKCKKFNTLYFENLKINFESLFERIQRVKKYSSKNWEILGIGCSRKTCRNCTR